MLYYVTQIPNKRLSLYLGLEKKDVGVIAIYFSELFDSVCHNLLDNVQESSLSDPFERVNSMGFSESLPVEFLKVDY